MKPSNQISQAHKAKIHIAKKQLNLDDKSYRDILSGFINNCGQPCASCSELNFDQAEALLHLLKKLGFKETRGKQVLKYEEYANRDPKFATPKMMRMIDALWHTSQNVREKTDEAMNRLIKNRGFADHIIFLLSKDVSKVINAIKHL